MNYKNYYKTKSAETPKGRIEQLLQLVRIVWDGDLISKPERDFLVKEGLAEKGYGFNFISLKGIKYLLDLGLIHP